MEFSFHIPQTTRWIQWFRDSWNFCAIEQKSHKSLFLNKPAMGNRIAATSCWISGIFGWWLMCRSERDRPSLDELSRFLDQNPRWSRLTCCRCWKLIRPPSPGQFQLGTDVSDYVLLQSKATNISLLISICCFVFFFWLLSKSQRFPQGTSHYGLFSLTQSQIPLHIFVITVIIRHVY